MQVLAWPRTIGVGRMEAGILVISHRFTAPGDTILGNCSAKVELVGHGSGLGFGRDIEGSPPMVLGVA